jgi:cytochrome P450
MGGLWGYLTALIASKRAAPEDDLLSGLVASGELDDAELTGTCLTLLVGGYESSATMFSLGTYALLTHPDQLAALRADPDLLPRAVDELLRYLSVLQFGTERAPLEDVEVDGVLIRVGEAVLLHWPTINRDPARFTDPDRFDITRTDAGAHLSFGHGSHHCIGQSLARIELLAGFGTLLRRFPDLRLADPADPLDIRPGASTYGPDRLPVVW